MFSTSSYSSFLVDNRRDKTHWNTSLTHHLSSLERLLEKEHCRAPNPRLLPRAITQNPRKKAAEKKENAVVATT